MLIQKSKVESRVFNLDRATDLVEYNAIIDDPAVRILDRKWIQHTESETMGRDRTEVKEQHLYVEWETCSL